MANVNIKGNSNCGALVGNVTGNAKICGVIVESGSVSGVSSVGGLVGFVSSGSLIVNDCDNHATITAITAYAGGIMGRIENDRCDFNSCNNIGEISAPSYAGNFVGYDGKKKSTY